jgi:hypothetical protein
LSIYGHKPNESLTYLHFLNGYWYFKTNLSGISPVFMELCKSYNLIRRNNNTKTSGYFKDFSFSFLSKLKNKAELFQGVFDGDGHYGLNHECSLSIALALSPDFDSTSLVNLLPLVPTSCVPLSGKTRMYSGGKQLYEVRFAPASIVNLNQKYTAEDIVAQLKFMLESAKHSIRPDKVHALVSIINRITSRLYGENRNSYLIQRKIRDLSNKNGLKALANKLIGQYPIKEGKYQPFMPLWAKKIVSRKEWFSTAWDFFFNKENLVFKNYPFVKKFNFEKGVPIDFSL